MQLMPWKNYLNEVLLKKLSAKRWVKKYERMKDAANSDVAPSLTSSADGAGDGVFLGVVRHAAGEHERQDGEREHVEDADHGEDVGPADAARGDLELVGVLAADAPHLVAVPAQRGEDAAQEQQQPCSSMSSEYST